MNAIIYLVRSSNDDILMLNKSLSLLGDKLLAFTRNFDILIFHEADFAEYKDRVISKYPLIFKQVDLSREYDNSIKCKIPEFFPHPTHGNGPVAYGHPGFSIGYRNMCRFFSGDYLNYIKEYKYYLRLDTDSYILTPLNYDIFSFAENHGLYYGYCKQAVQIDNPKVVEGLLDFAKSYISSNSFNTYCDINSIESGKMFYTNIELGLTEWFLGAEYSDFYREIDSNGGIYIKRWGDAPIKYLGVNLFCPPERIIPLVGFTYQHGAIYNL